jgi:signal transduction histidine kinase
MNRPANRLTAQLELENARLRGDLLTLAKRFSHDLRTPLGGIVSTGEAVREVLSQHDPSAVALADSLLNSAEEMTQLIKQVSFVARASASPLPKTTVHMTEPVFIALQRLESRILKRQAVVKEPPSWPVVPGVPTWLEVIWWHFILNALKHGAQNCRIELGWTQHKDSIRFWLSDNGPGVPEILRGKLFKEFDSLHAEQSVPGLGLSIVQRLVELQGGTCGYETPEQGGARFFFTLPVEGNPAPRVVQ